MRTQNRCLNLIVSITLALLTAFSPLQNTMAQEQGSQIHITQVDNSRFPQVTVYVSVTNAAGEPVGVDPTQIQVYENGVLMNPGSLSGSGETGPLSTLLLVDVSGSMNEANKLQGAKDAANAYVEQMRPGDQAGLLTFNTRVDYVQPLTTDHTMLSSAIHKLVAHDDTAMIDALSRANDILKDIPGRKAIIVLTDGLDNVSKTKPEDVINAIGPSGLSISTIGLGDPNQTGVNSGLDETGLMSLAERAGGVYSYANDPTALRGLFERYGRALQSEYSLTYTSPSKLRDGVSRILTVSLATQPDKAAQAQYNPGGVLPEVAQSISWPVFGGILAGLMVLLFIPFLINRIAMAPVGGKQNGAKKAGGKQKPRIKLN